MSRKKYTFCLKGKEYTESKAVDVYVEIIKMLAADDKELLRSLARHIADRKNKWLSQSVEDMAVYKRTREISAGWWLDVVDLPSKEKLRRLSIVCEVAGIPFGKPEGLKITIPKAVSRIKEREPESEKFLGGPRKKTHFFLRDKEYTESIEIDAYVKIIRILADEDKDFLRNLAKYTEGGKKKWLSRNREDMVVYNKRAEGIFPGWWLDTDVENKYKLRNLRTAREVAGIPFGASEGLKVNF